MMAIAAAVVTFVGVGATMGTTGFGSSFSSINLVAAGAGEGALRPAFTSRAGFSSTAAATTVKAGDATSMVREAVASAFLPVIFSLLLPPPPPPPSRTPPPRTPTLPPSYAVMVDDGVGGRGDLTRIVAVDVTAGEGEAGDGEVGGCFCSTVTVPAAVTSLMLLFTGDGVELAFALRRWSTRPSDSLLA